MAADQRPPVGPPFFAFRIMVGIAVMMLFMVAAGRCCGCAGGFETRSGFCAVPMDGAAWLFRRLAGWTTTEVGRQPWTVYGLLRTAYSVSPSLTGADVALSLALYVAVYLIMFPTGIALMAGLVRRGPQQRPSLQ